MCALLSPFILSVCALTRPLTHPTQFHYSSIQPIVAQCCADHGVPYRCLPGAGDALMSHMRHLHTLGNPPRATKQA